ncbi:HIT family protein [Leptolyngbya sp. PCC 6406]|uniref:HIT family protein n=1 Tax=Leptolyngbya sp. PCC 6406 TaxID=1173264 RepID=UPI0002AC3F3A|nr:HIT family hydrolase, diadenosine tetraphosphate hydrolase [Leptolyngbya sp. PCC 6406]
MVEVSKSPLEHPDCLACQILAGQVQVPGGMIAENAWWVADHCLGAHGLGAIVVKSRTHRDNLWDLTPKEAATLGPFLQRLTQAMVAALGAERIYINSWVDQPPYHVHFLLQPRYSGKVELGLQGLELQVYRSLQPKPKWDEAAAIAIQIRNHLSAKT